MKKVTGMSRKVDELGRIVIPIEIRRSLGIEEGTLIDMSLNGHDIILRKVNKTFCEKCGQVVDGSDKFCRKCGKEL